MCIEMSHYTEMEGRGRPRETWRWQMKAFQGFMKFNTLSLGFKETTQRQ